MSRLEVVLGRPGPSLSLLGSSRSRLVAVLACLGAVLETSWGHLGSSWGSLGSSWVGFGWVVKKYAKRVLLDFRFGPQDAPQNLDFS